LTHAKNLYDRTFIYLKTYNRQVQRLLYISHRMRVILRL